MNTTSKEKYMLLVESEEYQDRIRYIQKAEYLMFSYPLIESIKELCSKVLRDEKTLKKLYNYKFYPFDVNQTSYFKFFDIEIDGYTKQLIDVTDPTVITQMSVNPALALEINANNELINQKITDSVTLREKVIRYYDLIYDSSNVLKTVDQIISIIDPLTWTISRLKHLQKELKHIQDLPYLVPISSVLTTVDIDDYPSIEKLLILMYMIKNGLTDPSGHIVDATTPVDTYYNALTSTQETNIDAVIDATLNSLNLGIFYTNSTSTKKIISPSVSHALGSGVWPVIFDTLNIEKKGTTNTIPSYRYLYDDLGVIAFITKELNPTNANYYGPPNVSQSYPYKFSLLDYLYILGGSFSTLEGTYQNNLSSFTPSTSSVIGTLIANMHAGKQLV